MTPAPNIFDPQFESRGKPDNADFDASRAFIGRAAGSRSLGRPSLRTPAGWRELEPGEAVAFPRGEEGAHQIVNRSSEPARFLAVSTNGAPDITLYLDAGKIGASERRADGSGLSRFFFLEQSVDYWDGVDS
jgi:hypothetical protein